MSAETKAHNESQTFYAVKTGVVNMKRMVAVGAGTETLDCTDLAKLGGKYFISLTPTASFPTATAVAAWCQDAATAISTANAIPFFDMTRPTGGAFIPKGCPFLRFTGVTAAAIITVWRCSELKSGGG